MTRHTGAILSILPSRAEGKICLLPGLPGTVPFMERIGKKLMRHQHQRSNMAFTLIELLIVVAIIAILAAIAVPNFLEAQVRSKVARCKTDMRSITTALESYTVDYNRSILGWHEFVAAFGEVDPTYFGPWKFLTTPVAYMTSIPDDPFTLFAPGQGGGGVQARDYGKKYGYDTYYWSPASESPAAGAGYRWYMRSIGPSLQNPPNWWIENNLDAEGNHDSVGQVTYVYDATNGTKSIGLIARTNKGIYMGQ